MAFVDLGELTWPEAQDVARRGAIGVIPVGSVEQHGPHLPIAFDSIAALALVRATADRIEEPVVVPPLFLAGLSDHHLGFPGTVSLSRETFGSVLTSYVAGLERLGVARIAIVSAHGGNFPFIGEFGRAYTAAHPATKVVGYDALDAFVAAMFAGGADAGLQAPPTDVHAGLLETSLALHLIGPDRVRAFDDVSGYDADEPGWRDRIWTEGLRALTETGVLGLPPGATAEAGAAIEDRLVALLAGWLAGEFGVTLAPSDDRAVPRRAMPAARLHDGEAVTLRIHGSGPTILMHPQPAWPTLPAELLENKRALDDALVENLSDRYRLVMFEYPGSPKPRTLTPENVVRDLLAIAGAAGADRFAWCGYSWTAVIGLQLAAATDRLSALICGGWPPVSGPYERMLEIVLARDDEQMITFYGGLQSFDDLAAQSSIASPRLCFVGDLDDAAESGIAARVIEHRALLEQLGWEVRLLAGLDHVEPLRPSTFVSVVGDWLDSVLLARR